MNSQEYSDEQYKRDWLYRCRFIIPLIILVAGIVLTIFAMMTSNATHRNITELKAKLNATTYANQMADELKRAAVMTKSLERVVQYDEGKIKHFEELAAEMIIPSIQSLQLAPNGVVTDIYPLEGNEAGKIDLLHDKLRGKITRYGIENKRIVFQGPFKLKQGGSGIAVRNPIFLTNEYGEEYFWGLSIAIIKVPEVFTSSVFSLGNFGYDYRLEKTPDPMDNTFHEVYSCGHALESPAVQTFELGDCQWRLSVMPEGGGTSANDLVGLGVFGTLFSLMFSVMIYQVIILRRQRHKLRYMALTDALTRVYNRNGMDEQVDIYIRKYPNEPCVSVMMDIDDFKNINDTYGHHYGDKVLKDFAKDMKDTFNVNSIIGRNGGDEFCMILKNCTLKTASDLIKRFSEHKRRFTVEGKEYPYSISIGFAEASTKDINRSRLFKKADIALYDVKAHGKCGCQEYQEKSK